MNTEEENSKTDTQCQIRNIRPILNFIPLEYGLPIALPQADIALKVWSEVVSVLIT